MVKAEDWESGLLGSHPSSAAASPCELGQVTSRVCASVSSMFKTGGDLAYHYEV